jgi:hypothetical protein
VKHHLDRALLERYTRGRKGTCPLLVKLWNHGGGKMTYYNNVRPGQPDLAFGPVRERRASRGLGGVIAYLVLLALLAIPLFWIGIPGWQVRVAGVSTVGKARLVDSCGTSTDANGSPTPETFHVSIQFRDQSGKLHEVESHWNCNNFYNNGDQVLLWYLPSDPSRFLTGGEAFWLFITSVLWMGITCLVLLGFFRLLGARLRGRSASAYRL